MNIISPFTRIKKRAVMASILLCTVFWCTIFLVELILISTYKEEGSNPRSSRNFLRSTFYEPGLLKNIQFTSTSEQLVNGSELFLWSVFITIIPITLPAVVALILTTVQVYFLVKMDGQSAAEKNGARKNRQVEITIVTITLLFFVCSSLTLLQPLYWADQISSPIEQLSVRDKYLLFYIFGYIPLFVNAALNPVVLILRGEKLRIHFKILLGLASPQAQSVVIGNRAASARPQVTLCSGVEETAN